MKYTLTIASDNVNDIVALLQGTTLSGGTVSATMISTNDDDDDTGPAAEVAPGEVDAAGLPWDERIHAGTKKKNADGKWKSRRGVAADLVTAVEAELRTRGAATTAPATAPAAPAVPPPAPAPAAPAVPPPAPAPAHDPIAAATADGWTAHPDSPGYYYKGQEVLATDALAAKYPASAPAAAPVATGAAPAITDFAGLMQAISNGVSAGKIDADGKYVAELAAALGVGTITEIAADPAKIALAVQHMQNNGKL